jgi:Tfp pilus assembly protein PilF
MNRFQPGRQYKQIIVIFAILFCGLLAYSNTFNVPFQYDDKTFILKNPIVKNLSFFSDPATAKGLPFYDGFKGRYIGYLTFAINYALDGFDVRGFHIFNIIVHLMNAILVYLFVIITFESPFLIQSSLKSYSTKIAFFSALLFVSHPIQTEAVTYIFQRLASLVTFFYLAAIVSYAYSRVSERAGPRHFFYLLSIISAVFAMKTKENAFTLPFVIILYEFLFFRGEVKPRLFRLVPILLTSLIIPLSMLDLGKPFGQIAGQIASFAPGFKQIPRWDYFFTQLRVIVTYIRLLFLPIGQNIVYDYPLYGSFLIPQVFVSIIFLCLIFCLGIYLVYRSKLKSPELRLIGFGILWFFISISVESSIIPIPMLIDEYRVYLPSVGAFIVLSVTFFYIAHRFKNRFQVVGKAAIIVPALIVIALIGTTYARNTVWRDGIHLWEDAARKSPMKTTVYYNLAKAYESAKKFDKAIETYGRTITLDPKYFEAYNNLADVYLILGKYDKAQELFNSALMLNPGSDIIYKDRGRLYLTTRQYDKAIEDFTKAISLNPKVPTYYILRGRAYALKAQYDSAIKNFTLAIGLDPRDKFAYAFRGLAYSYMGNRENAQQDFRIACSMGYNQACSAVGTLVK